MPPHAGRIQLLNYLKREYPWKNSFIYNYIGDDKELTHQFNWNQINRAKKWAGAINPENYRILMYLTTSERTRQSISDALFLDKTTVRRKADRCLDQMMHYLIGKYVNLEDFDELIEPIDLRIRIEKNLE
jgi:hypothetical protein